MRKIRNIYTEKNGYSGLIVIFSSLISKILISSYFKILDITAEYVDLRNEYMRRLMR